MKELENEISSIGQESEQQCMTQDNHVTTVGIAEKKITKPIEIIGKASGHDQVKSEMTKCMNDDKESRTT